MAGLVAACLELIAVALSAAELAETSKRWRRWRALNPEAHAGGSWDQASHIAEAISDLIGWNARRMAIVLLAAGSAAAGAVAALFTL